ncbi:MAG TPA: hypothetical protein DIV39_09465 [Verrucomicrobiales bacterium]|nr:hypothetical protein [Verrucomicrobiales bacterium]
MITYSLAKAIAHFAENTTGDEKGAANKVAEVGEEVHLNSENNRAEKKLRCKSIISWKMRSAKGCNIG